jgi:hypothetical protein
MEKVESGEYPNINQAALAILARVKDDEERGKIYTEASGEVESLKKELDIMKGEIARLEGELRALKMWQARMDEISAVVAKYQDRV